MSNSGTKDTSQLISLEDKSSSKTSGANSTIVNLSEVVKTVDKHDEKLVEIDSALQRVNDSLKDNSTSIAIFALIFTFISINITLFSKVENLFQGIVFFTLFAWCLITIVYFVLTMKEGKTGKELWKFPIISIFSLLLASIISYNFLDGFTFNKDFREENRLEEKTTKRRHYDKQNFYIK